MMSEGVVARFLKAATAEMIRNNQKEIRCPCRRCKLTSLMDPKADMVRDHLLMRGFMDGYRWEGDEDDYEFVHGISTRNKEGGDQDVEDLGHDQDVEDPGDDHDHNVGDPGPDDEEDQDGGHHDDHEDEDDGPSSMDWVQDPYLQELLLKQTSNARAAAREKAKMDQLEVDAVTPLYEGCRPEDTRLKVTLMALEMKVKHKMTDTSFNDNMSFWQERLPKGIAMDEVRKKLFSISLSGKAAHWYKLLKNRDSIDWEDIVPLFYSKFYPPSEIHKDRNRIYNFWPHDGESIAQAWGRLKSLMLKCPIHELPGNVIIDNFYARLSFQDKTLLDTSCSGSFTRNKEEFKRDLLDRIQENTEGWENDKDRESDCKKEKILTKFAGESYEFNFSKFTKTPYKADLPNNDFKVEQCASIALAPSNPLQQHLENSESEVFREERDELDEIFLRQPILKHDLPVEDLGTTPPPKEDPVFDLKPLPDNLKYAHIDDKKIYPVIISSKLSEFEEERLLEILKKHRGAIGYTLDDLKGISPSICQHAINMEDDAKPVVEPQRRLIPKMKDVVRNEVLRLLEAGIIYPIADSRWVSHVHCVPKKGGMTVVPNDNDELIPQRVVVGYRMCIDF
ncbi:hypothetical protein QYE76_038802 [Lolium multiflorum]|uniref:Uncharacterized protein n=1 Tax=Lolium multiflorum TaxID=4521 RepID=A0AAD8T9X2_LOLMU|nr:hypothetical protein QYE76_038802 [Lolium multiflorum]